MRGKERNAAYYNQIFKEREIFNSFYKDSPYWVQWTQVIRFIGKDKSIKILDIGCGTGQLAAYLQDEGFFNYVGFDFSEEAVNRARARCGAANHRFLLSDALDSSSYDHDHDIVLCLEVLEHLRGDKQLLSNIQFGKKVIFSVPNFWDPSHVRRFVSARQIKRRYYKQLDIHEIVRVGNIYVCSATRSDFAPSLLQRLIKSREDIRMTSFTKRLKSYILYIRDSL